MSLILFTHTITEALLGCFRCADRQKNAALSPVRTQVHICVGRAPTSGMGGSESKYGGNLGDRTKEVPKFTLTAGCESSRGSTSSATRAVLSAYFTNVVYVWRCLWIPFAFS